MTDQQWLRAIKIQPYDADATVKPVRKPWPPQMIDTPTLRAYVEDGIAHMEVGELNRLLNANGDLQAAAENWCGRCRAAEKNAKGWQISFWAIFSMVVAASIFVWWMTR